MTRFPLAVLALLATIAALPANATEWPALKVGEKAVWDAQTDPATQTRFIPMQLIVPGLWDGAQRIELPPARDYEAEETVWNGPQEWMNPYTGNILMVYDRQQTTRREGLVEQKMPYATMRRAWAASTIRALAHQSARRKRSFHLASGSRAKSALTTTFACVPLTVGCSACIAAHASRSKKSITNTGASHTACASPGITPTATAARLSTIGLTSLCRGWGWSSTRRWRQ